MKKLLFLIFSILSFSSFAQPGTGSLTFFSDQGAAFIVYVNGVKQNSGPQSRVLITGLTQPYYSVKIEFANSQYKPLEKKNVIAADGDERLMSVSYKVRTEQGGKSRLVFYAMLPANSVASDIGTRLKSNSTEEDKQSAVSENKNQQAENKTILSNVSGATISMEKSDAKKTAEKTEEPKKIEHTKTLPAKPKIEAQKEDKNITPKKKEDSKIKIDSPGSQAESKSEKDIKSKTKKTNAVASDRKCNDWPMMTQEFEKAKKPIQDATSDDKRLLRAKEMSAVNCLLVSQISQVASLFSTEKAKLDYVTSAYYATIDKPNFSRLRKLFKEESIIKQFDAFMSSR